MKRISDQIADWLVSQGIEQVFSVTGGGSMFLNQALGGHASLKCTFMHHEQACAMAAEGYARVAGKPAVVMLTTGPGSINALNGVFGAYTDSIPMIVISGQVKRETCLSFHDLPDLRQLGDQEGPTIAMARTICKFAEIVRNPHELVNALPKAYSLAISGRPGPVWLDIPLDIQSSTEILDIADPISQQPTRNTILDKQCREIIFRLQSANRPLILGGTGVRLSGVAQRLLRFIEQYGIPMATAWTHDLIASDHPLFAGRPGTIGTRAGNYCLQNADVIIVLGSRLNIRQTSYNWDSFGNNAWIAQIDIDPAELTKPGVQADLKVVADARNFLDVVESALQKTNLPDYSSWISWCKEISDRFSVKKEHTQISQAPLNPYLLVDRIFHNLRPDDIVVCGNASACILPFQIGYLQHDQRLFSNSGSASMGYDLPASIGAAMASQRLKDNRRVICFAGDGSLQMNIQELQTLKTCGANIIIVVLNNSGYLSIRQTHENFFGRVIGATPATGVDFPDFNSIANAYGIESELITKEDDLGIIDKLLVRDGPLLINAIVDPLQEFAPRIKSRVDEFGKFITPELDDMYPFINQELLIEIRASAKKIKSVKRKTCA